MAGIGGQIHERVKYQKNDKKKSRTKTRKKGWQALGFKSYQQYLIAKKNGQLNKEEVIQEEKDSIKSDNGPKTNSSSSDQANQNLKKKALIKMILNLNFYSVSPAFLSPSIKTSFITVGATFS